MQGAIFTPHLPRRSLGFREKLSALQSVWSLIPVYEHFFGRIASFIDTSMSYQSWGVKVKTNEGAHVFQDEVAFR